jgi:hypothetical protein
MYVLDSVANTCDEDDGVDDDYNDNNAVYPD